MAPKPHRAPLTHFLCIPLVTPTSRPQLAESLAALAADITDPAGVGMPPAVVRPLGTLHLTLGVFRFPGPTTTTAATTTTNASSSVSGEADGKGQGTLDQAIRLLGSLQLRKMLADVRNQARQRDKEAQGTQGEGPEEAEPHLKISLRGLHSMQGESAAAAVLYATPDDGAHGTLQAFCERLRKAFGDAGLWAGEEATRPLLLHATLVNTSHAGSKDKGHSKGRGRGRARMTFDARGMMERYEDEVWMRDVMIDKVSICEMGAKKTLVEGVEDEAYRVVAEVGF